MDITILRKMTLKSVFEAGNLAGYSVQHAIDLHRSADLRWIYYNYSRLTFTDDVLDLINIRQEDRIEKPGKNPEKGEDLKRLMNSFVTDYSRKNIKKQRKRILNAKLAAISNNKKYTKSAMQASNQGH